jgi:hypothetical protein
MIGACLFMVPRGDLKGPKLFGASNKTSCRFVRSRAKGSALARAPRTSKVLLD